jgi:hypothetical protein
LELVSEAGLVGIAAQVVLEGTHRVGMAPEGGENLGQVEGTSLAVRHTAYQGSQDQEGHRDPNQQVAGDRMGDTVRAVGRKGDHLEAEGLAVGVLLAEEDLAEDLAEHLAEDLVEDLVDFEPGHVLGLVADATRSVQNV